MADDQHSSQTLEHDSQRTISPEPTILDLSALPPIFVSATHFDTEDLHELEEELAEAGAVLTYDVSEARVILTKVLKPKRVAFDLRQKGIWTEEVVVPKREEVGDESEEPAAKRRRVGEIDGSAQGYAGRKEEAIVIDDDETESEGESAARKRPEPKTAVKKAAAVKTPSPPPDDTEIVHCVKLTWFADSKKAGRPLPFDRYTVYRCRRVERPTQQPTPHATPTTPLKHAKPTITTLKRTSASPTTQSILTRAKEDADHAPKPHDHFGRRNFHHNSASTSASWAGGHTNNSQYAHLLTKTTTEDEAGTSSELPEPPEWVKKGVKYACQRPTPANSPNEAFIGMLKKIKLARLLTNDEIGVRAYSTSIASLQAYPYKISSPREILALPGCDAKIANLFVELTNTGSIKAVNDIEEDPDLKVLRLFYEIWGVGATTAREFYFDKGWRDLDDIVEYGWKLLTRVQQIGVKYYDEFLDPIPRAEVKYIGEIVHRHAVKVRDGGIQSLIVGGYRRGKEASGDVDIVVSHPDESKTMNIVNDIVASLEDEGWITHTLLLSLNNSKRDQKTLPFRGGTSGGHGFDTLDKALVVWQDPNWPAREADEADAARRTAAGEEGVKVRNPNIHRRVDIIISPWRTVGCAVAGWSSGTTFQRDLRRYVKHAKGWKFDSSGVRDRGNGEVVDVEGWSSNGKGGFGIMGWKGRAKGMEEAEKRVFEGLGLPFLEPWERCTG